MKITQDDLLGALRDALAKPTDGDSETVQDLMLRLDCGEGKVRKTLKVIATEGRLETTRVNRLAIDGTFRVVPGYRIKAKGK